MDGKPVGIGSDSILARVARRLADDIRIGAVIASSGAFAGKWSKSMTAFGGFFDGTIPETYNVCHSPSRPEKDGELVRVNWNPLHLPARLQELSHIVCLEIEPFIVGVGYVIAEHIPEGGIVVRCKDCDGLGVIKHG